MFDEFAACIMCVRSGEHESIENATRAIDTMHHQPGFLEYILEMMMQASDMFSQQFIATQIKKNIKEYWENDELYSDKNKIRNVMIQFLVNSPIQLAKLIGSSVAQIAKTDFPRAWPNLLETLASGLEDAQIEKIYAIVVASKEILEEYRNKESSHMSSFLEERNNALNCWDEVTFNLISNILPNIDSPLVPECLENVFGIIRFLLSNGLPDYYNEILPQFFAVLTQYMSTDPQEGINYKIQLCMLLRTIICQYKYEITNWGNGKNDEEKKKEPEEIQTLHTNWNNLLFSLFNVISSNDDQLVISSFEALTGLARNNKEFFIENNILEQLCEHILIPSIQLSQDDLDDFENNPLVYFQKNIEGNDSSKRTYANSFLRTLCRYFHKELSTVFFGYAENLLRSYEQDPNNYWINMDTALFIMSALAIKLSFFGIGVIEVVEGFDLPGFINQFILPQLNPENQFYILQTDALKFIVDFRDVIREIIPDIFPLVIKLLTSPSASVIFHAAYCMEKLLSIRSTPKKLEINKPQIIAREDIKSIIRILFTIFKYDNEPNVQAANCLLNLIVYGEEVIQPYVLLILFPCIDYLSKMAAHPTHPQFCHVLFEIIVASITKAKIKISTAEKAVFNLINLILSNNVTDYVPYTFQIIGTYLLGHSSDEEIDQFYINQFQEILNPIYWQPQGNIPGIAFMIKAYCIRTPQLIQETISTILELCNSLMTKSLSHSNAFTIFSDLIEFHPNRDLIISIIPQILSIVISQIGNDQLVQFKQSFAILMSDISNFLTPDILISSLQSFDIVQIVNFWCESITMCSMRANTLRVVSGILKVLVECTILPFDLWCPLFIAVFTLYEKPYGNKVWNEEIHAMQEEERSSMEFDNTFAKLVYSESEHTKRAMDKSDCNIGELIVTQVASWSHRNPGMLARAVETMDPYQQRSFAHYQEKFNVTFS